MKTLKEIAEYVFLSSAPGDQDGADRLEEHLRDEAREQIKELKKESAATYKETGESKEVYGIECEILLLRRFFNLEE